MEENRKKIREYFINELPADQALKALKNTDPEILETEARSIGDAICSAFVWEDSPEGVDYWLEVLGNTLPSEKAK